MFPQVQIMLMSIKNQPNGVSHSRTKSFQDLKHTFAIYYNGNLIISSNKTAVFILE
jgi:hypothetical protein